MANITKLCLEYLTLDELSDAARASAIPDEIEDIMRTVVTAFPDM